MQDTEIARIEEREACIKSIELMHQECIKRLNAISSHMPEILELVKGTMAKYRDLVICEIHDREMIRMSELMMAGNMTVEEFKEFMARMDDKTIVGIQEAMDTAVKNNMIPIVHDPRAAALLKQMINDEAAKRVNSSTGRASGS